MTIWYSGMERQKIKVLHLIKGFSRGGAETLLSEGIHVADRERFEFSYAYLIPSLHAIVPSLEAVGARVTCIPASRPIEMIMCVRRLVRHLREHEIDLIHSHLPAAGLIARLAGRLAGIPVIYTEHNKVEWYHRLTYYLNAWTYEWQSQVIAVSESVYQSIFEFLKPRVPVRVIRNGIDTEHFNRSAAFDRSVRRHHGIPADAPVIGNVAALIPQKRLHDWLEAARLIHLENPRVRGLIVGNGPGQADLEKRVAEYGLHDVVHLVGVKDDVRPYLFAMNVYMMSSAFEGLPVALLEAMAMECVPVCTAVGGIPEVIDTGKNGVLTETGRPDQLAAGVLALIEDPILLEATGQAARETVKSNFQISRMVREVEETYLEVLGRKEDVVAAAKSELHVA
jgi:L-malate glycosyltransferase